MRLSDIPPETERAIVAAFLEGRDPVRRVLAPRFGLSETGIYRLLKRHGLTKRPRQARGRFSDEQYAEMATLYEQGVTMSEIARRFQCTLAAVRARLLKHGVAIRSQQRWTRRLSEEERGQVLDAYRGGDTQEAIAKRLGTSDVKIGQLIREYAPELLEIAQGRLRRRHHGMWRGGRIVTAAGYIKVWTEPDDPLFEMADSGGYIGEHRLVMAKALGRLLAPSEHVHHVNGNPGDNRLENLQLRRAGHGNGVVMECSDCGSRNVRTVEIGD